MDEAISRLGPKRFVLVGVVFLGVWAALVATINAPSQIYGRGSY